MKEWIIFLLIHVIVPAFGIGAYLLLIRRMKREQIPNAPSGQLFWIFGTYGVLFILVLTALFWKWSAMASLGVFASASIGPIILGIIAFMSFRNRRASLYHSWTFRSSAVYVGLVFLVICASLINNIGQ